MRKKQMPNLKVKPLEWYMQDDIEGLAEQGYVMIHPRIGRDGYYCQGIDVWFEYDGRAYWAYPSLTKQKAKECFCYTLAVNDEAILPKREVEAMKVVLKTCRDAGVKKAIRKRLNLHEQAVNQKYTGRNAQLSRIRILGY